MRQKHNLLVNFQKKNEIIIPVSSLYNQPKRKKTILRFGTKAFEVNFLCSKELAENEIQLPKHVVEELKIPVYCQYELSMNFFEIRLGPYIGILACKSQAQLHEIVQNHSNYLYDYEEIGGAVLAFSEEGIDSEKLVIQGYIYNPQLEKWVFGNFEYPSSIFRRAGLNKKLRDHFHARIGNCIFNNYFFNKWEMYEWLSSYHELKPYLPETIRYRKTQDVIWFLENFSEAYIKPIFGSQGEGILTANKNKNSYEFRYKKEGIDQIETFYTEKDTQAFLKERMIDDRFLVQQGINVLKNENSIIDFRLLLVKDYAGSWVDMGLVARHGVKGSMVSNVSSGGHATKGEVVMKDICGLNESEVFQLRNKLTEVATQAAECLEKCGIHCGNLGFDFAIDNDFSLWIIEINNRDPNHTIAIDAGDRQMFYRTKKMNMLYAKRLAGF